MGWIISIMILVIAAIVVPNSSWNLTSIFALISLSLSAGYIFYIPSSLINKNSGNDAVKMFSIGPSAVIALWLTGVTAVAFLTSLFDLTKVTWVLEVIAIGSYLFSLVVMKTAGVIVSNAQTKPSNHLGWQAEIQGLSFIAEDAQTKSALGQLAEKLRYSASDVSVGTGHDKLIESEMESLSSQINSSPVENFSDHIRKISNLISKREVEMRNARSKA